jgi:exosortase
MKPALLSQLSYGHVQRCWFLLKIGLLVLLVSLLYARVLLDLLVDWWTVPAFSQGLLIPPLAICVAWIRRKETLAHPAIPDTRGLLLTAAACVFLLLGRLGAEFFLSRISFVMLIAGLTWTFWGRRRFHTLVFPLLLLSTMVPLPSIVYNTLSVPLQLIATESSTWVARLAGVTLHREGNLIQLAGITMGVEEACSGLSSLSALIVTSLLLGFIICSRVSTRLGLLLAAIPIAIAANILRVAGTALIADHYPALALGFYHLFSGWLVFLSGFIMLWLTARVLNGLFLLGDK